MAEEDIKQHSVQNNAIPTIACKVAVVTLVVLAVYAGFLRFSHASKEGELSTLQSEISRQSSDLIKLEKSQVKEVLYAKQVIGTLQSKQILWSEVISLLLDATPDDIVFRSFSGNENASVTMSAVASSFERISSLLDTLDKKPFIKNVFIPSVVKGTTPTNASVYSFSLNIEYEQ